MRVLITRPEQSAKRTAERIRARGHEPLLLPLTQAVHDPDAVKHAFQQPCQAIAVTSAEAVRACSSLGPAVAAVLRKPLFAVGKATAKAAETYGFRNIHVGPGTGEGLAELVATAPVSSREALLYLAGTPRSPSFEEGLVAKNIKTTVAEIYRMVPLDYAADALEDSFVQQRPEAVLLYSRESARLFFQLAAPYGSYLKEMLVMAISPAVVEVVPAEFRTKTMTAERPDEDALVALL